MIIRILIPKIFTAVMVFAKVLLLGAGFSGWNNKTFAAITLKSPEGDFAAPVKERIQKIIPALV
jgi:hypothetical protein